MEKAYNLFLLFDDEEISIQKGYNRYSTEEAYFLVLEKFTLESDMILEQCQPERYNSRNIDIVTLMRNAVKLEGLLLNIGATGLALRIQNLNILLDNQAYDEYLIKFCKILIDVERLRERIISAEKHDNTIKTGIEPCYEDFERLLLLIENNEYDRVNEIVNTIMSFHYASEINKSLEYITIKLYECNFDKASKETKKLLKTVADILKTKKSTKKIILAIDDRPDVLRRIKAKLRDKYNVFCMTNYDSAVRFLRRITIDLILFDIEMVGYNGLSMMHLFKNLPKYAKMPIIFLTGSESNEHVRAMINLGADDFVKKPVDFPVLINKLDRVLM